MWIEGTQGWMGRILSRHFSSGVFCRFIFISLFRIPLHLVFIIISFPLSGPSLWQLESFKRFERWRLSTTPRFHIECHNMYSHVFSSCCHCIHIVAILYHRWEDFSKTLAYHIYLRRWEVHWRLLVRNCVYRRGSSDRKSRT